MDARVKKYIYRGNFFVDGWLRTDAALTIFSLHQVQRKMGAGGGVAEIGVHYGKLFILLYLLSKEPELAVAIDLFSDQHLNIDQSGGGEIQKFVGNLELHADSKRLIVFQGNSLDLTSADLLRLAKDRLRLISIDGGHTAESVAHDLEAAEGALSEAGIVIVDDVFNDQFPGVVDGVHAYFARPRDLVPFAIGANKTYFCRPSHRDAFYAAVKSTRRDLPARDFLGYPVEILDYWRPNLKDRVAHSRAWRDFRTTPPAVLLRRAWQAGRVVRRFFKRSET